MSGHWRDGGRRPSDMFDAGIGEHERWQFRRYWTEEEKLRDEGEWPPAEEEEKEDEVISP